VTGSPRPSAGREDKEEEDDLPDDDKDKAPASAPAAGEVAPVSEQPKNDQPPARTSSLTSSIRDRVKKHDNAK